MTAQQFSFCSHEVQFEIIKQAGVCLLTRQMNQALAYLFSVDTFYVEIVQNRYKGQPWNLRSFDDVAQLDPYLSEIDITPVLNQ